MTTDLFDPGSPETGPLDFVCPRCSLPASARFYGPCDDCRELMRTTIGGDARDVKVAAYEPKMNVTPNAVASKD